MLVCMKTLIQSLIHRIASWWRERWYLSLEYLALRHQLEVLKRSAKRPRFDPADRCLWILLSTWWPGWPQALELMQADTVRRWRRQGIWHHLKWRRGRKRPGRPPIPAQTRNLIRDMSRDNVLWGAPRIQGELAKIGINVSRTTVAKYMTRRRYPPSPTWRTFLRNQAPELVVAEIYAELSGRLRAVSTGVVHAFQRWVRGIVSGWVRRFRCHDAPPFTEQTNLVAVLIAWALGSADPVRVSKRSPPESRRSFTNQPFPADPLMEMGRVDMRPNSPVLNSWAAPPNLSLTSQADGKEQKTDVSKQAAA
jgi:hypothetical protein